MGGFRMKWNQFLGGILIGAGLGLMVGGAIVQVPEGGRGERKYPLFPSMVLTMTGVIASGIGHSRFRPRPHDPAASATSVAGEHSG
jgi:hypothetical protein